MKVTFLGSGTSQGVPVIGCQCEVCTSSNPKDDRLRSSVLIEDDSTAVIIDTGPDFRQQMLRHAVRKLDGVVFTHGHKDHTAGFDDIRAFNFIQQKKMDVYGDHYVKETLMRDFYYAFEENKYPGVPELHYHTIDTEDFSIGSLRFTPIEVLHYKLPVKAFRVGDFTYVTDANRIAESEKEKIRGSKVLVLNALRKSDHISHFTLEQAIALGHELDVPTVYFTHISHQMGLHDVVEAELPDGMHLAFDGLEVVIK